MGMAKNGMGKFFLSIPSQLNAKKETDAAIARNPSPGGHRNTALVSDDSISQENGFDNLSFLSVGVKLL